MTEQEIQEFQKNVGAKDEDGDYKWIQLFGYTSTSTSRDQAMSFAWENKTTGHSKVLFQINWDNKVEHYFLNAGAYDYEQEIVLYDSVCLCVLEVREILNDENVKQHTLIVLGSRDKDGNDRFSDSD